MLPKGLAADLLDPAEQRALKQLHPDAQTVGRLVHGACSCDLVVQRHPVSREDETWLRRRYRDQGLPRMPSSLRWSATVEPLPSDPNPRVSGRARLPISWSSTRAMRALPSTISTSRTTAPSEFFPRASRRLSAPAKFG
jgi:hypothetical protein